MPRTWAEEARKAGWEGINPRMAKYNITLAGRYLGLSLWNWCQNKRLPPYDSRMQRIYASQAGYNTGCGNVNKARRKAGGSNQFSQYGRFLLDEPRDYVKRINCKWYPRISGKVTKCEDLQ